MADGVDCRVDRLRAVGNGQIPAVVAVVWKILTKRMEQDGKGGTEGRRRPPSRQQEQEAH